MKAPLYLWFGLIVVGVGALAMLAYNRFFPETGQKVIPHQQDASNSAMLKVAGDFHVRQPFDLELLDLTLDTRQWRVVSARTDPPPSPPNVHVNYEPAAANPAVHEHLQSSLMILPEGMTIAKAVELTQQTFAATSAHQVQGNPAARTKTFCDEAGPEDASCVMLLALPDETPEGAASEDPDYHIVRVAVQRMFRVPGQPKGQAHFLQYGYYSHDQTQGLTLSQAHALAEPWRTRLNQATVKPTHP